MEKKTKIIDSTAVQALKIEAKKVYLTSEKERMNEKKEKKVFPDSKTSFPDFRNRSQNHFQ